MRNLICIFPVGCTPIAKKISTAVVREYILLLHKEEKQA